MKRGDIVLAALPGDFGKPRPVLIVQSDLFNPTHATLIVCPITTDRMEDTAFRISVEPAEENGLRQPSQIMVDKIIAARRDRLRDRIGAVDRATLNRVEQSLRSLLNV
ncbi:MAG: type II toxin-antitoxin system PemK/MazF family toxin [Gammaproteobacteria bacterium]